jgi:N-methylhydantoinase A
MKHIVIGVDIGGTFTDIVALDYLSGATHSRKVLTTYADPTQGVTTGIELLFQETGIAASQVVRLVHATTLFTNALIEGKGVPTGLLMTEGFSDIIEIGRERRYDLYDVQIEGTNPVVPRHLREEIGGRLDANGSETAPLNQQQVLDAVGRLTAQGVQSLAICLMHSYANASHEQQVKAWIQAAHPDLSLSLSSEVAPEIREFDRVCTTAANACVQPIARQYLDILEDRVAALGIDSGVLMMLSNGGLCAVSEAKRKPIELLESGPAAGAISAAWSGAHDAFANLLAFDMGGTTAKLSLVENGHPEVAYSFEAARRKRFAEGSGIPIKITTVDLIEIGAGGGSIARGDDMGLLKVGPDSSASEPGPACYNRGGLNATVTDANLVLGYLNPDFFAGGTIHIDVGLARHALQKVGDALQLSADQVAQGIYDIVAENMAGAARVHVAERGHDPRDFVMVCTGGGGPLHGYAVARKIGVRTLISPAAAGVASAIGLLVSPARSDRSRTLGFRPDTGDLAILESTYAELESGASASMEPLQTDFGPNVVVRQADGRFVGQGFTLTVELPAGPYAGNGVDEATVRQGLVAAFEAAYRDKFGRTPPNVPIELVSLRANVTAMPRDMFKPASLTAGGQPEAKSRRSVFFAEAGTYMDTPIYTRASIPLDTEVPGPLLVEDSDSTLVVGPSGRLRKTASGNLVIQIS